MISSSLPDHALCPLKLPAVPARFASRNSMVTAISQIRKGEETNEGVIVIILLNFEQFLCIIIGQLIGSNISVMLFWL
jgi:hypothetical protein